jgi:hypothetical protein
MAFTDELDVGEPVTVTDLRTGARWAGTLEAIESVERVQVRRSDDGKLYGMHPSFVTPLTGEADNA